MIQNLQQVRARLLPLIMAGVVGVGFSSAATSAGLGVDINGGAGVGAEVSGNPSTGGAAADGDMNASGSLDRSTERQDGAGQYADPASDRMNPDGSAVEFDATGKAVVKDKR